MFSFENGVFSVRADGHYLKIEPYKNNAFRIRVRRDPYFPNQDNALLPREDCPVDVSIDGNTATLINGDATLKIDSDGRLLFYNSHGVCVLKEISSAKPLKYKAREFIDIGNGKFKISALFDSIPNERIFGMGQYQEASLNRKGCMLELAQRNSQASVPFYISDQGYGFLWNMPAIGEVVFAKNITKWHAQMAETLDYLVIVGDTPRKILEGYMSLTGTPPIMPEYAMGLWQSKLRYQTQKELLDVAREYKRRGIPLSFIVCDFFHWPHQGDFKFDTNYFPDPRKMVQELNEMGTELMVSVWPTIEKDSESYQEMKERGFLVKNNYNDTHHMECVAPALFYDTTNNEAGSFVWSKIKKNYYNLGIKAFWLDEAEPEYILYDFDNHSYAMGQCLEVGNIYPLKYAQNFYDGMKAEGQKNILNLIRCAWAGSQRYGTLVWSGDIMATYHAFRCQVSAGLNMAMSGIPWWTTDIGGFDGGRSDSPEYRRLIVRWFEYATFCPVLRMHGCRSPWTENENPISGGGLCGTAAPNEIWSYGDEAYEIFKKYIFIRERLKPYIKELMSEAHRVGTPPMRPLFYDFPSDEITWDIDDEFMFGKELLVSPVINENEYERAVYLPKSDTPWIDVWTGKRHEGGKTVLCDAPLDKIPLFIREGGKLNRNIFIGE